MVSVEWCGECGVVWCVEGVVCVWSGVVCVKWCSMFNGVMFVEWNGVVLWWLGRLVW